MNVHVKKFAPAVAPALDVSAENEIFARDVIAGLSQTQKQLSPKYFYDEAGSQLFEQITLLPEYYPTRTELRILRDRGGEIAAAMPDNAAIVEFGAGATTKIRLLLNDCAANGRSVGAYVPVDISGDFLKSQARALKTDYPQLKVLPVVADFTHAFALPDEIANLPKVGFFPGSTLGNFDPPDARAFLQTARESLGPDAALIIGIDLEKDDATLQTAYDDTAGVTARFNLNVLTRINRELGGNFDVSAFAHRAIYNRAQHRIEMHLVSTKAQTVRVLGHAFAFKAGESVHTESSYKYSIERFAEFAHACGWNVRNTWTDAAEMFSLHLCVAESG